jgi:hypothetical protein
MTILRIGSFFPAFCAAALLIGCVNNTALDDLKDAKPQGTPFSTALYKNYRALARSFGPVGASAGRAFGVEDAVELTSMDSRVGKLANDYAEKALIAARGSIVEPEPGVDITTHKMRDRLIRVLDRSRDSFPADSARAQADFDCWMMNATVRVMQSASKKCHAALEISLARVEAEAKPAPTPPPAAPAPTNSEQPAEPVPSR